MTTPYHNNLYPVVIILTTLVNLFWSTITINGVCLIYVKRNNAFSLYGLKEIMLFHYMTNMATY